MVETVTISVRPVAAVILAVLMSCHAVLFFELMRDETVPAERWQIALIGLGWFWWARLLWLTVLG